MSRREGTAGIRGATARWAAPALVLLLAGGSRLGADCSGASIRVGDASGAPGGTVEVTVYGRSPCPTSGFSFAIVHDPARLKYSAARPSDFVADYAKAGPLKFIALAKEAAGCVKVMAIYDLTDPVTVPPLTIPDEEPLAVITYEILAGAAAGQVDLLNRDGQCDDFSNVFSGPPGEAPVLPVLTDGSVLIEGGGCTVLCVRGDANRDNRVNIADPIFLLSYLFQGADAPPIRLAADANDDRKLDISDSIFLLQYLFSGGEAPAEPFPAPGPCPCPGGGGGGGA